jgi:hypothetical protein
MTHTNFTQLLRSIKGLTLEQVRQLRQQVDTAFSRPSKPSAPAPIKAAESATPTTAKRKPTRVDDLNRKLFAAGRLASLPDPSLDIDDDDPNDAPIAIEGEPLSETMIRERR